jgi:putative ABC transport system substrate-binding protein
MMLRNAAFVLGFGLAGLALVADAQQATNVYRIGRLSVNGPAASERTPNGCPIAGGATWQPLIDGLREFGYVPGKNLVIECRYTEGQEDRAPALAAELVKLKVDLLLVFSTPNVRAAKAATRTIPIVMYGVQNPVGRGLVANLARPGGNVTGLADDAGTQVAAKYLQLLKEAAPHVTRVAVMGYVPEHRDAEGVWSADLAAAAERLHLTLKYYNVDEPEDLESAFATMKRERADALLVLPHPFMAKNSERIVALATRSRLPAIYPERGYVTAGGLLGYGPDLPALRRRVAFFVDRILKGAKPADLPVEQPSKFELIVNLNTAQALGITIPQTLLMRADEVIQ